eukprot:TRINITY_DN112108_c0_g1_i1.p1 TRINITY_DN112108_c0_g1~~TRINITY_DN112108_c0_g1_i1.p1  ORF type:complete len:1068 (+),score=322.71 TRINITY_DN112108_c0_g1_i1:64-3267(+)
MCDAALKEEDLDDDALYEALGLDRLFGEGAEAAEPRPAGFEWFDADRLCLAREEFVVPATDGGAYKSPVTATTYACSEETACRGSSPVQVVPVAPARHASLAFSTSTHMSREEALGELARQLSEPGARDLQELLARGLQLQELTSATQESGGAPCGELPESPTKALRVIGEDSPGFKFGAIADAALQRHVLHESRKRPISGKCGAADRSRRRPMSAQPMPLHQAQSLHRGQQQAATPAPQELPSSSPAIAEDRLATFLQAAVGRVVPSPHSLRLQRLVDPRGRRRSVRLERMHLSTRRMQAQQQRCEQRVEELKKQQQEVVRSRDQFEGGLPGKCLAPFDDCRPGKLPPLQGMLHLPELGPEDCAADTLEIEVERKEVSCSSGAAVEPKSSAECQRPSQSGLSRREVADAMQVLVTDQPSPPRAGLETKEASMAKAVGALLSIENKEAFCNVPDIPTASDLNRSHTPGFARDRPAPVLEEDGASESNSERGDDAQGTTRGRRGGASLAATSSAMTSVEVDEAEEALKAHVFEERRVQLASVMSMPFVTGQRSNGLVEMEVKVKASDKAARVADGDPLAQLNSNPKLQPPQLLSVAAVKSQLNSGSSSSKPSSSPGKVRGGVVPQGLLKCGREAPSAKRQSKDASWRPLEQAVRTSSGALLASQTQAASRKAQARRSRIMDKRRGYDVRLRPHGGAAKQEEAAAGEELLEDMHLVSTLKERYDHCRRTRRSVELEELKKQAKSMQIPMEDVLIVKSIFDSYDTDKSGFLDEHEFEQAVIRMLRYQLRDEVLDDHRLQKIAEGSFRDPDKNPDRDGDGGVSLMEFINWYATHSFSEQLLCSEEVKESRRLAKKYQVAQDRVETLRRMFENFDGDNSGEIDLEEFKRFLVHILKVPEGHDLPERRIQFYWILMDRDGSGKVNFEEFLQFFVKNFGSEMMSEENSRAGLANFYAQVRRLGECYLDPPAYGYEDDVSGDGLSAGESIGYLTEDGRRDTFCTAQQWDRPASGTFIRAATSASSHRSGRVRDPVSPTRAISPFSCDKLSTFDRRLSLMSNTWDQGVGGATRGSS